MNSNEKLRGLLALSPLAVFMLAYLLTSAVVGDFDKVPVSSTFLLASIYAVIISRNPLGKGAGFGASLDAKLEIFSSGAGNKTLLQMVWIFVLAGAFAQTAKDIGSIEGTVNLTLRIISPRVLYAGLFVTACFISMAIGTSIGTIVALVPLASGIASQLGADVAFLTAIVVGGAFFGDNLSFISDTTIAATKAMECRMNEKFKANLDICAPAFILVTIIYIFNGAGIGVVPIAGSVNWILIMPYLLVLVLALCGVNVALTLTLGIILNLIIGLANGTIGWASWLSSVGSGIGGMGDLIIVTMLAGGMMEVIRYNGGLEYLINRLTFLAKGRRGAEACIALLVSLTNLCTANNTIAIITTGSMARDIADRFNVDRRRVAGLMDTFSCAVQGLLPYGAQLLMASGMAGVGVFPIIGKLYYPMALGAMAILSIIFQLPTRYTGKKNLIRG